LVDNSDVSLSFVYLCHFCLLHYVLSLAGQCTVIGPVCGCVVCRSATTITQNCVHRFSPNWVFR